MKFKCRHLLAREGMEKCPTCGSSLQPLAETEESPKSDLHDLWQPPEEEDPDAWRRDADGWTNDEYLAAAKAKRARESLAWFVRECWHVLEPATVLEWGPHLQAVCDHVQWILEDWIAAKRSIGDKRKRPHKQKVRNALFWLAPRSLKTRIILECAPAWVWLRFPSWSVRCVSINPAKALESARNMRQIVESEWYQNWFAPRWRMRDDRDAVGDFGNTRGGYRKSSGIGAEIIGAGTDAIFMDDPNAPTDDDDALKKVFERWMKEISGRVNDRRIDVRIIVQQRIDVGDLSGRLLAEAEEFGWMVLQLPLYFVPERRCETPYGWVDWRTERDQLLHERYTEDVVREMRKEFGPQFEAICQQNPSKRDGENFKMAWWKFWRLETEKQRDVEQRPKECTRDLGLVVQVDRYDGKWGVDKVVVTVDPTGASEKPDASHVGVLGCVNVGAARLVVEDFGRGPRSYPDMLSDIEVAIIKMANLTGHLHVHLLIEKTALGPALIAEIEMRVKAATLRNKDNRQIAVTIDDYKTGVKSKESRGKALEVPISVGEVYVREGASWLDPFFDEFKRFPKKPNDKVDALAQYVDHYRQRKGWRDAMQAMRG